MSEKRIPSTIVNWFNAMEKELDYDCIDNWRWARLDKSEEVESYLKAYKSGCCGYVDEVITDGEGNVYVVGLNYGH